MAEFANAIDRASPTSAAPQETTKVGAETRAGSQQGGGELSFERLGRVRQRAGTIVVDEGQFEYVVTPEGGFRITIAPAPFERSVGAVITIDGKYQQAWKTLAAILETTNDQQQCVEPPTQPAPDQSIGQPAPSAPSVPTPAPPSDEAHAPVLGGTEGLYYVRTTACKVRKETGAEVSPRRILPQFMHVRVYESKRIGEFTNARIAAIDEKGAVIEEIGWASLEHMFKLERPNRGTTASAQMSALLSAARSAAGKKSQGGCYAAFKRYVRDAGGYGDILNIQTDERIPDQFQGFGRNFHDAIARLGPAAFGLEAVGGLPMSAPAGTVLVTLGNGRCNIDPVKGDVAVIEGMRGDLLIAYNDGEMPLYAKESDWTGNGEMAGSLLGMYKPVDRP